MYFTELQKGLRDMWLKGREYLSFLLGEGNTGPIQCDIDEMRWPGLQRNHKLMADTEWTVELRIQRLRFEVRLADDIGPAKTTDVIAGTQPVVADRMFAQMSLKHREEGGCSGVMWGKHARDLWASM